MSEPPDMPLTVNELWARTEKNMEAQAQARFSNHDPLDPAQVHNLKVMYMAGMKDMMALFQRFDRMHATERFLRIQHIMKELMVFFDPARLHLARDEAEHKKVLMMAEAALKKVSEMPELDDEVPADIKIDRSKLH